MEGERVKGGRKGVRRREGGKSEGEREGKREVGRKEGGRMKGYIWEQDTPFKNQLMITHFFLLDSTSQ